MTNTTDKIVNRIRNEHRQRRFAMKIQQKLDRALESYIRINATDWNPDMVEKEREKINTYVKTLIKDVRAGKDSPFVGVVQTSDKARLPADDMRKTCEKQMEQLVRQLPIAKWFEGDDDDSSGNGGIRGIGALGVATIIAETGDLSNYPNVGKVWKRLGFAPYDGFAGSSWKRESWRPRALSKEEWIDNPFSGQRYALIFQVGLWLRNAQWIGKSKTDDGKGKPNGFYGEVYAKRRAHTAATHPGWSDGHADKDAIRVMMKEFLKRLWLAWREIEYVEGYVPHVLQAAE